MKWSTATLIALIVGLGVSGIFDILSEPKHAEHPAPASYTPAEVHAIDKLIEDSPATPARRPTVPLVSRIAHAESGGNAKARNAYSTASGLCGFTRHTWRLAVAHWGKELGIHLRDKGKPWAQKAMTKKLAEDNGRIGEKKLGRPLEDWELYAFHFLGARDGAALLAANEATPNRKAVYLYSQGVVDSNRTIFFDGKRARTVAEICQLLINKIA